MSWGNCIEGIKSVYKWPCTDLPLGYFKVKLTGKKKPRKIRKEPAYELSDEEYFSLVRKRHLKNNKARANKTDWCCYKRSAWAATEKVAPFVKGIHTRGFKKNHIDHIVPISFGFKNKIPLNLIASADNLEMLPHRENMNKAIKLSEKSIKVLKKWGYEISKHQKSQDKPYANSKGIRIQKCEQFPLFLCP